MGPPTVTLMWLRSDNNAEEAARTQPGGAPRVHADPSAGEGFLVEAIVLTGVAESEVTLVLEDVRRWRCERGSLLLVDLSCLAAAVEPVGMFVLLGVEARDIGEGVS